MRFRDRTIIITGASLGVGRATAELFHREGANVVMVARRLEPLEQAAAALGDGDRTLTIAADVADNEALAHLVRATVERFGGIGGLVNNAGAHFRGPVATREPDELSLMVDVNLRAPIALSSMVLPHLRASGGFIVNVASLAGKVPLDGAATYSATKFGLRAFSYAMAEELRGTNVSVSVVSPGPIDTGFIMDELDEVEDIVLSQEICSAEDVAQMILACASDQRVEREFPVSGAKLATLAYLVPGLRRWLKPRLVAKGAAQKARLRRDRGGG
ncbi:short-chain dehydrogenase/reductase SDR [Enhygromyxa salina]|uniref:Short-chain dehydrogenase/reductase SDR n=1 Tax=Enhygromyxa salina TaxID=215803 RepID=A0A0C2DGT0_9BACT|nr:SDR family NAD(P)-dependent oxidoreductase [Enhygromyxa salina]KIG18877.1 short-chain dehydrogenase/reductase SDR [Enhygromyxa salina]